MGSRCHRLGRRRVRTPAPTAPPPTPAAWNRSQWAWGTLSRATTHTADATPGPTPPPQRTPPPRLVGPGYDGPGSCSGPVPGQLRHHHHRLRQRSTGRGCVPTGDSPASWLRVPPSCSTGCFRSILLTICVRWDISADVDAVVISHAHSDHHGGLRDFLLENGEVTVFAPTSLPEGMRSSIAEAARPWK